MKHHRHPSFKDMTMFMFCKLILLWSVRARNMMMHHMQIKKIFNTSVNKLYSSITLKNLYNCGKLIAHKTMKLNKHLKRLRFRT